MDEGKRSGGYKFPPLVANQLVYGESPSSRTLALGYALLGILSRSGIHHYMP